MINNIEDIKKLFAIKKENANKEDMAKINNLDVLLDDDNIFFELDMDTSLGILSFLGISDDKLLDTYQNLTKFDNFKNNTYVTISNRR